MKNKLIKIFLFIGLLFVGIKGVYADSTFTFKIDGAQDIKVGDVFAVNVSVSGPDEVDTLTGYNLTVGYDTNKLELVEGSANIVGTGTSIAQEAILGTLKFKPLVATDGTKLELSGTGILVNGEDAKSNEIKTVFNAATVSSRNIGTDSSLKSLKIPNTVLSPEFNKNVYDYKATVTDVTSIDIKAEPSDGHSSVSVNEVAGNLQKGENDVVVVCTAENGTQSSYAIKVTLNLTPTEEELKAQDSTLKSLAIKGQKIEFSPTEKKYYINVDYDTTKINISATPTNPEAEVTITGNEKLVLGKNTVKILVTSADKTKSDTYQIIVTRAEEEKEIVKTCPDTTSKKEWIIFTVSLLLTFTLGIVLGYFLCKSEIFKKIFKKKKEAEEAVEINTLSDTIDLSDTVKKASKEIDSVEEIETIDNEK